MLGHGLDIEAAFAQSATREELLAAVARVQETDWSALEDRYGVEVTQWFLQARMEIYNDALQRLD